MSFFVVLPFWPLLMVAVSGAPGGCPCGRCLCQGLGWAMVAIASAAGVLRELCWGHTVQESQLLGTWGRAEPGRRMGTALGGGPAAVNMPPCHLSPSPKPSGFKDNNCEGRFVKPFE